MLLTEAHFFHEIFGKPVVKAASFVRDTSSLEPLLEALEKCMGHPLNYDPCRKQHGRQTCPLQPDVVLGVVLCGPVQEGIPMGDKRYVYIYINQQFIPPESR